jgi:hypothetical protein
MSSDTPADRPTDHQAALADYRAKLADVKEYL